MTDRIFRVGLNGRPGNLEALLEAHAPHICEVFAAAPPELMGSGRIGAEPIGFDEHRRLIGLSHEADVAFNLLFNAICFRGGQFQRSFRTLLREAFQFVVDSGVDTITIADPFVMYEAVRFREQTGAKFVIYASSFFDVMDAISARRVAALGADRIVLHQNTNRDFKALREIRDAVSCELELYANTGSIFRCPYRQAHRAYVSHVSECRPDELDGDEYPNWFKNNCTAMRRRDPIEILMAPTIRPEDVDRYLSRGISSIKLSGRSMPTEWMVSIVGHYVSRRYDGNIADLCDTNLGQPMPIISNRALDGFLDFLEAGAKQSCYQDLCQKYYKEKL